MADLQKVKSQIKEVIIYCFPNVNKDNISIIQKQVIEENWTIKFYKDIFGDSYLDILMFKNYMNQFKSIKEYFIKHPFC